MRCGHNLISNRLSALTQTLHALFIFIGKKANSKLLHHGLRRKITKINPCISLMFTFKLPQVVFTLYLSPHVNIQIIYDCNVYLGELILFRLHYLNITSQAYLINDISHRALLIFIAL